MNNRKIGLSPLADATRVMTAAQMKDCEGAAMASGSVTGEALMERAGAGVVAALLSHWPELAEAAREKPPRALVLCGPGNNGGDGFVIARLLLARNWDVSVLLFGKAERLPADARTNHDRWQRLGPVHDAAGFAGGWPEITATFGPFDVTIDALFGTGLSRSLPGPLRAILAGIAQASPQDRPRHVAVDIPSGLCADSGRVLVPTDSKADEAFSPQDALGRPDLTVSFHTPKAGHILGDGPAICASLICVDIGLDATTDVVPDPAQMRLIHHVQDSNQAERSLVRPSKLAKRAGDHKFAHGHVLCLTGDAGKTGAARLAARAALRVGAGLVTLGVPQAAQPEVAAHITAEMMTRIETDRDLATFLQDPRINALCLGPGLGRNRAEALVATALADPKRRVVLDADALSAFSHDPQALFTRLHTGCVLTPHGGEFQRLFPDLAARLKEDPTRGPAYSKIGAARAAAERAGCVVLFKGPDTVIAAPDGRCVVHAACFERAAPWLATAGAGDVLAGLITGLLARGRRPVEAAALGAWLHVEAARRIGPGLVASDLPEALPGLFRTLKI